MFYHIKNVVIFLKFIASLLILRSFGDLLYDIADKYKDSLTISNLRKLQKTSLTSRKSELTNPSMFLQGLFAFGFQTRAKLMSSPSENGYFEVPSEEELKNTAN